MAVLHDVDQNETTEEEVRKALKKTKKTTKPQEWMGYKLRC